MKNLAPMESIPFEAVTPKLAAAWLNANKSNRRMRDGVAEKYANDMKLGRWTRCPEPITFYDDGDLADGQHRLWAVVESNTTQIFPVMRGLTRADGLNVNTGFGRTVIDNGRISGADTSLSHALISAARAIEHGTMNLGRSASNSEVLEMVDKQREAATFATSHVKRRQLLCGAVVLGAVGRAYLHEPDKDRLRRFCEVLGTGYYDGDGETAAITLRNYLLTRGSVLSIAAMWRDTFFKCQNAIYYFMRGKKLTTIKGVSQEAYPLTTAKYAIAARTGYQAAAAARAANEPGEAAAKGRRRA